jgi:hypothetical protein
MMPSQNTAPVFSNVTSTVPISISAGTDQALFHVGAQFYAPHESPKLVNIAKASGSSSTSQKHKFTSASHKVLETYLQVASRTEILCLGIQSPHSSRVFDNLLICAIDALLLQIESRAVDEVQ